MSDAQDMSEQMGARLQGVMDDVLASEGGGFTAGFVGVIKYIDKDGANNWSFVAMGDQALDTSLGMLRIATKIAERQVEDVWGLGHE